MASEARRAAAALAAAAVLGWALAAGADAGPEPPVAVLDHETWRDVDAELPEVVVRWVRDGAWFGPEARVALPLGPTRPAPLPASYRAASERLHGSVRLREDGLLEGWEAGLPFPDPAPPQLAEKILWNQYYRWRGDDVVIDTYRTVQTDARGFRRETRGVFELLTVAGRTDGGGPTVLPGAPRGVRTMSRLVFTYPPESKWTTTLFHRWLDPTRDDAVWAYLPSTRRVLRVQGGQRCTPVRGSDFTPDDFFGFDGRVWEHEWRVVGEGRTVALVHQQHVPTRLDERGAWPVDERWELRDVWIVEGTPRDDGYCYGRRRLWIDRETYFVLHADVWDRAGAYWKGFVSAYAHRPIETGEPAPVWLGTGAYDFQIEHLTYVTVGAPELGRGYRIGAGELRPTDFTPSALLRLGR